jgi:rhamnose utilization protein RhaD (predicted bifunctional aldolase and dehydrogenase)
MTKAIWAMAHGVATVAIANRAEDSATAKMAIAGQVAVYVGFLFDGLAL